MSELLHERHHDVERDDEAKAAKRLRKAERTLDTRQLDPWERYRALIDLLDTYVDMVDIADRKARFALLILGALNALNLVFVVRPQLVGLSEITRPVAIYGAAYIIVSLFLLVQAIAALRPRAGFFLRRREPGSTAATRGVRFIGDVVEQTVDEYYDRWARIEVGELNRELARHIQNVASINVEKYRALNYVYHGLIALAVLTTTLVVVTIVIRMQG
jgi:hypothetical protein